MQFKPQINGVSTPAQGLIRTIEKTVQRPKIGRIEPLFPRGYLPVQEELLQDVNA